MPKGHFQNKKIKWCDHFDVTHPYRPCEEVRMLSYMAEFWVGVANCSVTVGNPGLDGHVDYGVHLAPEVSARLQVAVGDPQNVESDPSWLGSGKVDVGTSEKEIWNRGWPKRESAVQSMFQQVCVWCGCSGEKFCVMGQWTSGSFIIPFLKRLGNPLIAPHIAFYPKTNN